MKKFFCVILPFLLIGCSNSSDIKPILRNISFTAEMTYYNEYYEMTVDILKNGDTTVSVCQPEEFKGLIFNIKSNNLTCEFNGITLENNNHKASAIIFLYSAFKNENPKVNKNKNSYFIEGKYDGGDYTMYITESGLPLKICDSSLRFEVIIKNLTLKNEKEP